ncbi:MAG: hypothetical protein WKF79_11300 [Nocardioides sp.]
MGKDGVALGADLYELWSAGQTLLPTAAQQVDAANFDTPFSVGAMCSRAGPIGMGANGPAGGLDSVLDLLNQALTETSQNLKAVGEALIWVANEYARTDEAAAAEFHRKQRVLGDG